MKTAVNDTRILYWAKSKYHDGDRNTADDGGEIVLPQKHALRVARQIDLFGQSAVDEAVQAGAELAAYTVRKKIRAAAGHGVLIVYKSGRHRNVRAYD